MDIALLWLALLGLPARAIGETEHGHKKLQPRANASATLFHHRGFHNSIVVGNYLYIDGGEVTLWNGDGDGVQTENPQDKGDILTQPVNYTYSIDLSSSWTNSSVTVNTIKPKAAPVVNNQAIWLDADNKTFYAYDGGLSSAPAYWWENFTPAPNGLWKFTPAGESGKWSQAYVSPSSIFASLKRVTSAIYAYGNGLGFALGGIQSDTTGNAIFPSIFDSDLVPGMVVYNMKTNDWYNISASEYTYSGFTSNGAGWYVPSFGPDGLLFVFGGSTGPSDTQQFAQFEYLWMYEHTSKTWLQQQVSGDIPPVRTNQCIVGVQGDEGTYEIFMYGGQNNGDVSKTVDTGDVHVLSLPSFHWYKTPGTPQMSRFMHSCNVAGNRQMISVGGVVFSRDTTSDSFAVVGGEADPWKQGFGVFDMTEMEWKSSYSPNAAAYKTPAPVKRYIQKNGPYPATWDKPSPEKWFKNPGNEKAEHGSGTSDSNNNGSSSNVGAIAGGVVGGVAVLAIIAGLVIWFLWRRKRKNRRAYGEASADPKYRHRSVEADGYPRGNVRPSEMDATRPLQEMPVRDKPAEPWPGRVHELEGRGPG